MRSSVSFLISPILVAFSQGTGMNSIGRAQWTETDVATSIASMRRNHEEPPTAKWLSQILKQRARQLEICGFESFRESVIDESQRIPGLIALAVFGEQAG